MVALRKAMLQVKLGTQSPRWRLPAASVLLRPPESGSGGPEGTRNPLKWPKLTQNGSGQSPGRVRTGSTTMPNTPGAIGAWWGPCHPPGLHFFAFLGHFGPVLTSSMPILGTG